jgi:hypothetical protein
MAIGSASGAVETPLRYTLDPGGPPVFIRGQAMLVSDAPMEPLKLPRLVSKKPAFLTAKLGEGADRAFSFVVDESVRGAGHDLLYADGNHNRDLTDDRPVHLTRWRYMKGYKPVRLLIEVGGTRVQYHASIVLHGPDDHPDYRLQSWGYYSGEARFGEKIYPVAVIDHNGNGLFNDLYKGHDDNSAGDLLLIDVNGDGKFEENEFASPEYRPCARRVMVDGRYYDLSPRADGSSFTVAPATTKLATLRSGSDNFALMLTSDGGMLTVRSENGQAQVPVGDYRIYGWRIEQRDRDGSIWIAQGTRYQGAEEAPKLSVQADTTLPPLGTPLMARLKVDPGGGREFQYTLSLTAASGEEIGDVTRNGQRMPEPRLKVVNAQGKEIANVPFHYG